MFIRSNRGRFAAACPRPIRGQGIAPLYESVPLAAAKDQQLYELLALVDALRVGRARERALAIGELESRIGSKRA